MNYIGWSDEASKLFVSVFPEHREKPTEVTKSLMNQIELAAREDGASRVYPEHVGGIFRYWIIDGKNPNNTYE